MVKIKFFQDTCPEKKYTIRILLEEFLGLEVCYESSLSKETKLMLPNNKSIILVDYFFDKFNGTYSLRLLPHANTIKSVINDFGKIMILFGRDKLELLEQESIVHFDLLGTIFFMLSRWEEFVLEDRDKHNRFSAKTSIAFKFAFLHRPVVNECVEFLWQLLLYLGYTGKRKKRNFQVIPTHDVDLPRMWWNRKDSLRTLIGDFVKRKSLISAKWTCNQIIRAKKGFKDPFDTFDYLMNISEKNNLTSHFFFMSGGTSNKDNYYSINHPIIIELINEIKKRGHKIGFHPSYNAYNNKRQFTVEKITLEKVVQEPITIGRQHFLRFELPKTWQIWEENNMKWDSTMSYADSEGFRCGVCYPFPVFDIIERKELKLIERPLIVMDGSLVTYQKLTTEDGYNKINSLVQEVRRYNGEFVFLWHNSAFNTPTWNKFQFIYERILNENPNNSRS